MVTRGRDVAVWFALIVSLLGFVTQCDAGELKAGYYKGKCVSNGGPLGFFRGAEKEVVDVEQFIADLVKHGMEKGKIDTAALLRLHFHDCFVRGCDASILLDEGRSENERHAGPNGSVRGYEFIESVKEKLEEKCPGVVSCADIITLTTRDSVAISTKSGLVYAVRTGREDGLVSKKSEVNLPSPSMTVEKSIEAFKNKGLTADEMVYLLGAHTVGKTRCFFTKNRLNDPKINATLARHLTEKCSAKGTDNVPIDLDQGTPNKIDKVFFDQLLLNRGVLDLDQALFSDPLTRETVKSLSTGAKDFATEFKLAMIKLGEIQDPTSPKGVRKFCKGSL